MKGPISGHFSLEVAKHIHVGKEGAPGFSDAAIP
jgi:hypothetical protein